MRTKSQTTHIALEMDHRKVFILRCEYCSHSESAYGSRLCVKEASERFYKSGWRWIEWPKFDSYGMACPSCHKERDTEVGKVTP